MTRANGRMLTTIERLQLMECLLARPLPCGCQVGLYLTSDGRTLVIVDSPHDDCHDRSHQADFVLGGHADASASAVPRHGEAA